MIDPRDFMIPETIKWQHIADQVMRGPCSPCPRDGQACKTKWNQLLLEYKKITDQSSCTGCDFNDYYTMHPTKKKEEGLPRLFNEDFFNAIHDQFGNRPQIQPPHVQDLLFPIDGNYKTLESTNNNNQNEDDNEADPFHDMPNPVSDTPTSLAGSSEGRLPLNQVAPPSRRPSPARTQSSKKRPAFPGIPLGIVPHVIGSSEISQALENRQVGNMGVRRKNMVGYTIIATATKATGAILAAQMQGVAEASLLVEHLKVDLQQRSFNQHMAYLEKQETSLYENAIITNEMLALQYSSKVKWCRVKHS